MIARSASPPPPPARAREGPPRSLFTFTHRAPRMCSVAGLASSQVSLPFIGPTHFMSQTLSLWRWNIIKVPLLLSSHPHTQTSYAGTKELIQQGAGVALYNFLFARSIVTCRHGVGGVFLPWAKGLQKFIPELFQKHLFCSWINFDGRIVNTVFFWFWFDMQLNYIHTTGKHGIFFTLWIIKGPVQLKLKMFMNCLQW